MESEYRINWSKVVSALLLTVSVFTAKHIRDWYPGVYTRWSWAGIGLFVGGVIIIGILMGLSEEDAWWTTLVAALVGSATTAGVYYFVTHSDAGWKELLSGIITVAIIGGLIASIGITEWKPPIKQGARRLRGKTPPPSSTP